MSETDESNPQPDEEVERLRVKRENIGREMGSDLGKQKIRRKRKRVKESRDPNFRKDGKTEQDAFDPEVTAAEREEDAWLRKKSRQKMSRKQAISFSIAAVLLVGLVIGGLVYRAEEKAKKQSVAEQIFLREELSENKANTPIKDPKIAAQLSKSEEIAIKLPELREITLKLFADLQEAKTVEDLEMITRDYPGRESDLKDWLENVPEVKRPRTDGVFMNPVVAGGQACVQLLGELRDYNYFVTYLVEDSGSWVLDWESFTSKSEIPLAELRDAGAKGEISIRAMVDSGDFYTPPVVNDKDYSCYLARNLNELEYVWVYTPRGGRMDNELKRQITGEFQGLDAGNKAAPTDKGTMRAFRLRVRPLYGSILKSQFELVKIEGHGWLNPHQEANDE